MVREAASVLAGRERELAALVGSLDPGGPLVVFVHGPAGTGKTTLLNAFAEHASSSGAAVVRVDCRSSEPTGRGFLDSLSHATDAPLADVEDAAAHLERLGETVVVTVDTYEMFRISDAWLRSSFAPALPRTVRLVLAGREPPLSSWLAARGNPEAFRSVLVGALPAEAAVEVLRDAGLSDAEARAVNRVVRGHPLALQVAAGALRERPDALAADVAIPRAVEELTRLYVDHLDAPTRRVLDAASAVRRVTVPLLAAMLPDVASDDAVDRLATLPFVEESADGLRLHESVQEAIAARLRARDPVQYRRYRAAAWRSLRREVGEATPSQLWRYTADMLYLLENPAVREAFFPTTAHLYGVEQAETRDAAAIEEITALHEPPESGEVLMSWWRSSPRSFRVVRDRAGAVVGYMIVAEADKIPGAIARNDPVVVAWREHQSRHPLPRGQKALYDRVELSREWGGAPSPVQATTWLDIKRIYMQMRPNLGRLYSVSADPEPFAEALQTLGFEVFPATVSLGRDYTLVSLTFGAESVDGWLAGLAAAELGVEPEGLLDAANHELIIDDERVQLTPLEFGVMQVLLERKGNAASRADLIERVWQQADIGGSNVVDVVVRSLRKKLGAKASSLQTVRGVGYRFRD